MGDAAFVRGFFLLDGYAAVLSYRTRVQADSLRHQSFHCIYITRDMSSVELAHCLAMYKRKREDPMALRVLRRAGLGPVGSLGAAVTAAGGGALLEHIVSLVVDRIFIVARSNSIQRPLDDEGFRRCTTHFFNAGLPRSVAQAERRGGSGGCSTCCVTIFSPTLQGFRLLDKHAC